MSGAAEFRIAGLKAMTAVHPGVGQALSAVDLPVLRESTTGFPYAAGSSIKGALRDLCEQLHGEKEARWLFGKEGTEGSEGAGQIVVSDARLLLLPVRSLEQAFTYVTCPTILLRICEDFQRASHDPRHLSLALKPADLSKLRVQPAAAADGNVFLEELYFETTSSPLHEAVVQAVAGLFSYDATLAETTLAPRLVILDDTAFSWFAEFALPVRARNALEKPTKTVKDGALWYEETIPPEAVAYLIYGTRPHADAEALAAFEELLPAARPFLQVGGNETVGQGWFRVSLGSHLSDQAEGGADAKQSKTPSEKTPTETEGGEGAR